MRRPANLVLPAEDARTRLKQRTNLLSRFARMNSGYKGKRDESDEEIGIERVMEHIKYGPENDEFAVVAAYLNDLSNMLKRVGSKDDRGLGDAVIDRCLQYIVYNECQIRAMSYYLIRLSIHHHSQLQKLLLLQLDIFLIRSMDFTENEAEREEAFKLMYKLLSMYRKSMVRQFLNLDSSCFTLFPKSALKCIMAIALEKLPRLLDVMSDNGSKPDNLCLPCLGVVMELAVIDPDLVIKCAGTGWIVRSVVGPGANKPNVSSLVIMILIKWMDTAELREKAKLHLVVEQIFAPLIDLGFFHQKIMDPSKDDPPPVKVSQILDSVSAVFLSLIKTWEGIFACGAIENGQLISSSPFKLLDFLGFGTTVNLAMVQIRDMIINICCEFVDMPYASKKFTDWSDAIYFYSKMHMPDRYKTGLRDDFVVGEIEALQTSGVFSANTVDCLMSFRAVACYILINAGLPQALARLVMARPDDPMSIKATVLLSDLLRTGASFLPSERRLMLLSVPSLIQAVSERSQLSSKLADGLIPDPITYSNSDNASILIHRLDQLNDVAFNRLPLHSQLTNIELFVNGGVPLDIEASNRRTSSFIEPDERFEKLLLVEPEFFSKVTAKALDLTHLESIVLCLESENGHLMRKHKHSDKLHSFFSRIFTVILPANGRFVSDSASLNGPVVRSLCRVVKLLVPLCKTEPHYGELIDKFLNQFKEQVHPDNLYKGVFNLKNILNYNSHYYFALLSAIGSTYQGQKLVEDAGIYQIFMDLVMSTTSIEYIKLFVSSMHYTYPGITRVILETALTATDHQSRKWCTRFLSVLAGTNAIPDFATYGMKLLIAQLADKNIKVVRHSVRLLHFWLPQYPEALPLFASVPMEPLGSAGTLLKTHLFGSETHVQAEMEATRALIEFWLESYQKEYVQMIEEDMKIALLNVKRSIDGTFARPSSERYDKFGVPMPVHLFAQLSRHETGRSLLMELQVPTRLLKTLVDSRVTNDEDILSVKAAMLSLGHIAGHLPNGLIEVLLLPETIPILCRYSEECPTLSVRGTAIWALNLVGLTEDGARVLASLGWESNRHLHVVEEVCEEFCERSTSVRSRLKSGCRWIHCIDGVRQNVRKCLSFSNLASFDETMAPKWQKNEENLRPRPRRRVYSDSQMELPFLFKKKIVKKDKLAATKSMPMNGDEVRPDRTFTHESAVTSGFGSAQDEHKDNSHTAETEKQSFAAATTAAASADVAGGYSTNFFISARPKDKSTFNKNFAPSFLTGFADPLVSIGHGQMSFGADFGTSLESEDSVYLASQIVEIDREKMAIDEQKHQPHFSTLYRKQHGISGFEQQTVLQIPNRAHSRVSYHFLCHAEMKNVEKYERMIASTGEWVPYKPSKEGRKACGSIHGWTVCALPTKIELVCKNIFKTKATDSEEAEPVVRPSYQRCFYCLNKMAKGLSTNHFHSIDSEMRSDVLKFVSMFEVRGNSLQKKLTKKYGDKLQIAFGDPCLYSDALEVLADLNHGVKARKEVHKLFIRAAATAFLSISSKQNCDTTNG